ncbi:MAG: hypothetical protein ABSH06_28960 [Thermodesulfobacteriota bacterium]
MCQPSDSLENSVEVKSYPKRCNTMGRTNASSSRVNMEWNEQDTWFVTFTFAIAVGTYTAEEKIKEWLRRLRQTLVLKEDEMFVSSLFAPQDRGVWHVHMEVKAEGLNRLSQQRWEEKWADITGRKVTHEIALHRTHRVPGIIRRRNGEETVFPIIKWEKEVIGEQVRYVGGGTCVIRQVGRKYISSRRKIEYTCTVEGIRWYLEKRHSSEMKADNLQKDSHNFLGIL